MKDSQVHQFYDSIKTLAKKDAVDFDFYGSSQGKTQVWFQKKELKNHSYSETNHFNLRVLKGKKSGASWTKDLSKKSLEDCYRRAVDSLKLSDKEERGDLSSIQKYPDFSSFYNTNFKKTVLEDKIKKTKEMSVACFNSDPEVQPVYSQVFDSNAHHFFANSCGSQSFYKASHVLAQCYSLAVQGDSRTNGHTKKYSRSYRDIDFEKLGKESANKALKKLNYSIPKTKKYPVVFKSGQAVGSLLSSLADLMNGKKVFESLSLFKDSLHKKIFSQNFSLHDDPLALWGMQSQTFDGEGFAMEKTSLVCEGILENYLTSSFYAKALKAPHTKKACWIDEQGILDISATNLVMSEGAGPFEELVDSFPQVIVIDYLKGFAGYNAVSGDFSIESEGFLWEGGEAKPLCQFTVSGNIKQIFSRILKIAGDSKVYAGMVRAPSFLVEDLMIAGR